MFTLGILYLFLYCLVMLGLFLLSFTHLPFPVLTQWSLPSFFIYINRYSKFKQIWLMLFFSLTGLPPVGLFFVKFNIIASIIYQTHVLMFIIIFLVFFMNMLYYVQVYNTKNSQKDIYNLLNHNVFKTYKTNLYNFKQYESLRLYKLTFYLVNIVILTLIFNLIFSDVYFLFCL